MVPAELKAIFCGVFCSLMLVLFWLWFLVVVFFFSFGEGKTAPILAVLVDINAKLTAFFPTLDIANNISVKE